MKKLSIFIALLLSGLALATIVPAAAQTLSVPVTIPVRGQFAVTGDMQDVPSKVNPEQLFTIDTYLGDVRFLTRSDLFVKSPKWNSTGDQIAFQNGPAINIWHVPNGPGTVLPVASLSKPQSWSPDNSEILYSRYDISTTPATQSLNVLTLSNMTSRILFAYQEDQPLNNLPLPSLPPGVTQLVFYDFRKADWNPVYPDWIAVEIDGSTAASTAGTEAQVVPVTFVYNLHTGQMLSLDSLFTESISNGQFAWSPDGQYLAIVTSSSNGGNTHLVSFEQQGSYWALGIVKSAPSGYQVLRGWLGAGDLLLTGANDPNTGDPLWFIAQIFDEQWHYTEFFRLPKSTFFRTGESDWHITASEPEKQTLTCLFDQTMPAQLTVGMRGQVTFTGGTASRLRSEPGIDSTIVTTMPEGMQFDVIGGTWCIDGYRWWQLELDDHTTGWAAEADNTTYFLEPYTASQPPVANAGTYQPVTDTDGNGSETVTLDGSASTDDGTIVSYSWSEGTTSLGDGATLPVTLAIGTHTITLTVTDDGGLTDTDEAVITVSAPQPVVVNITVPPADGLTITDTEQTRFQAVAYDSSVGTTDGAGIQQVAFEIRDASDNPLYSFADTTAPYCALGGGSPCNPAPAEWTQGTPGTYQVRARAQTTGGQWSDWVVRTFVIGSQPATDTPTLTPTDTLVPTGDGEIVFTSSRDGNFEIYRMNTDGTGVQRLTTNAAIDIYPVWFPNRDKILFSSSRDGNMEVYAMNADGSGQTRLTNSAGDDYGGSVSPDGSKIAFISTRDGDLEIFLMNADGTGTQQLTSNTAPDIAPSWSPDGSKIGFTSYRDGNYELYTMNLDGTNPLRLTNSGSSDEYGPVWSPDGSKIAFVSNSDGDYEVYTANPDLSGLQQLTVNSVADGYYYVSSIEAYYGLAWSPDGSQLVFISRRDGNLEVYRMNADGSAQTRLTNTSGIEAFPDW